MRFYPDMCISAAAHPVRGNRRPLPHRAVRYGAALGRCFVGGFRLGGLPAAAPPSWHSRALPGVLVLAGAQPRSAAGESRPPVWAIPIGILTGVSRCVGLSWRCRASPPAGAGPPLGRFPIGALSGGTRSEGHGLGPASPPSVQASLGERCCASPPAGAGSPLGRFPIGALTGGTRSKGHGLGPASPPSAQASLGERCCASPPAGAGSPLGRFPIGALTGDTRSEGLARDLLRSAAGGVWSPPLGRYPSGHSRATPGVRACQSVRSCASPPAGAGSPSGDTRRGTHGRRPE